MPINSGSSSLGSAGANRLVRVVSSEIVQTGSIYNNPLRFSTDYSTDLAQKGTTVGVKIAPDLSSRDLVDGNTFTADDDVGTTVDVVLSGYKYSKISATDAGIAADGGSLMIEMIQNRINLLRNDVVSDVFSTVRTKISQVAGTYQTDVGETAIKSAVYQLAEAKAPRPFIGLVRHDLKAWGAISSLSGFEFQVAGQVNPNVDPNVVAPYYRNVFWYETQAVKKGGVQTDDIQNVVYSPKALAVAMRALPGPSEDLGAKCEIVQDASGMVFSILKQWDVTRGAEEIIVRCLYGFEWVKPTWAVLLKS